MTTCGGFPPLRRQKIRRILAALEFADDLTQIAVMPGWKLHSLRGTHKGAYSIVVTANWRITFRLEGNVATDLDF